MHSLPKADIKLDKKVTTCLQPEIHYSLHESQTLDHTLSEFNLTDIFIPYFSKVSFNILPFTPIYVS
jgi:hypothetical protein